MLLDEKSTTHDDEGGISDFLIRGLVNRLPKPDSTWSLDARAKWLRTAASIFGLVYRADVSERGEISINLASEQVAAAPPRALRHGRQGRARAPEIPAALGGPRAGGPPCRKTETHSETTRYGRGLRGAPRRLGLWHCLLLTQSRRSNSAIITFLGHHPLLIRYSRWKGACLIIAGKSNNRHRRLRA